MYNLLMSGLSLAEAGALKFASLFLIGNVFATAIQQMECFKGKRIENQNPFKNPRNRRMLETA